MKLNDLSFNESFIALVTYTLTVTHTDWRQAAHAILFYFTSAKFHTLSEFGVGKSGLARSVIISKISIKDKKNQMKKYFYYFQPTCCILFTKHAQSGTALSASASIPQDKKLDQVVVCQFGFNFH